MHRFIVTLLLAAALFMAGCEGEPVKAAAPAAALPAEIWTAQRLNAELAKARGGQPQHVDLDLQGARVVLAEPVNGTQTKWVTLRNFTFVAPPNIPNEAVLDFTGAWRPTLINVRDESPADGDLPGAAILFGRAVTMRGGQPYYDSANNARLIACEIVGHYNTAAVVNVGAELSDYEHCDFNNANPGKTGVWISGARPPGFRSRFVELAGPDKPGPGNGPVSMVCARMTNSWSRALDGAAVHLGNNTCMFVMDGGGIGGSARYRVPFTIGDEGCAPRPGATPAESEAFRYFMCDGIFLKNVQIEGAPRHAFDIRTRVTRLVVDGTKIPHTEEQPVAGLRDSPVTMVNGGAYDRK